MSTSYKTVIEETLRNTRPPFCTSLSTFSFESAFLLSKNGSTKDTTSLLEPFSFFFCRRPPVSDQLDPIRSKRTVGIL